MGLLRKCYSAIVTKVLEWDYYKSVRKGLLRKCYSAIITKVLEWDYYKSVRKGFLRKCYSAIITKVLEWDYYEYTWIITEVLQCGCYESATLG